MDRSKISSLVRHAASILGGILISKGLAVDGQILEIIGASMSLLSIVFSIVDKTYTLNMIEGTIRQVLTTLSGFLAFQASLTPNVIEMIMSGVSSLLISYLGFSDKLKPEVPAIDSNTVEV